VIERFIVSPNRHSGERQNPAFQASLAMLMFRGKVSSA